MNREEALLTGLTRLLGVYYGIRAVDQSASSVFIIYVQKAATPEMEFPSAWSFLIPSVLIYVGLAAAVFFLAPIIARAVVPKAEQQTPGQLPWNDTMIFCAGLLFLGWGFGRLIEWAMGYAAGAEYSSAPLSSQAEMLYVALTGILIAIGAILMSKFHRISAWMLRRRQRLTTGSTE